MMSSKGKILGGLHASNGRSNGSQISIQRNRDSFTPAPPLQEVLKKRERERERERERLRERPGARGRERERGKERAKERRREGGGERGQTKRETFN